MQSISTVPPIGESLAAFVAGPLRAQTERVLGDQAAATLLDGLEPMIRARTEPDSDNTYLRLTKRPSNPAYGAPLALTPVAPVTVEALFAASDEFEAFSPGPLPTGLEAESDEFEVVLSPFVTRVLVATHDDERVAEIARELGDDAEVRRIDDVIELFDSLGDDRSDLVFLVVDSLDAAVTPMTLATNLSELPSNVDVVLWGVGRRENGEIATIAPESSRWARLELSATPRQLAGFLRDAMTRRSNGETLPARR